MSIYAIPALRPDDLIIPQGADFSMSWPLFAADGAELDTAGFTARAQVRAGRSDVGAPLYAFSAGFAANSVVITAPAADSAAWPWYAGVYDVEVTAPDGKVSRVAYGRVRVDAEVSR